MKMQFTKPGGGILEIKEHVVTVGDGKPGAKSTALANHYPLLEKAGFDCYPMRIIPPAGFREFINRCGANPDRPQESQKAIDTEKFTSSELALIKEAMQPFIPLGIAVRSDEPVADGNGVWHSDFMIAGGSEEFTDRFSRIVKSILLSDFSRDAIAFKRRLGLTLGETSGVFVMPTVDTSILGRTPKEFRSCMFHLNVITRFRGSDAFIMLGLGLGGANNRCPASFLSSKPNWRLLEAADGPSFLDTKILKNGSLTTVGSLDEGDGVYLQFFYSRMLGEPLRESVVDLRKNLATLNESTGQPAYLELALAESEWVALQYAPLTLEAPMAPDVAEEQKIMKPGKSAMDNLGTSISGRTLVIAESVVCANRSEFQHVSKINEQADPGSYVLIFNFGPDLIDETLSFADYSNAAAVLFNTSYSQFHYVLSHISGPLRVAGIPVIVGPIDKTFFSGLNKTCLNKVGLLVYANDAEQTGFVATI